MSDAGERVDAETAETAESAESERRLDLRETYRQQMLASIGGFSGSIIAAIPPVVFVVVNAITGLRAAVLSAIGTALLLTAYRLVRRQSIQQAVAGLFGVVVAALIAARTGQARGYFLLGIWSSFLYGGVFAVSAVARRPLVGLLWEFLDPTPSDGDVPWYRRSPLLRAYLLATLAGAVVFLARGVVQLTLFQHNATGWLAFARIAMGFPLWILAVAFGYWAVTRARKQLAATADPDTA